MASPFLTARWKHLALITYAVPPKAVEPYMPPGCAADTRDGDAFVSLVAFDFLDTQVAGIRWPGFVSFPEVNLRFYVRQGRWRGVAFIKELVPQAPVAWMANLLYNEPYVAAEMMSEVVPSEDELRVYHRFETGGASHEVEVWADPTPHLPASDSTEHFFKEHDRGYGTDRRGRRVEYRVHHRHWRVFDVRRHRVEVDFAEAYGDAWKDLSGQEPCSVVLAEGSAVGVYPGGRVVV